MRFGGLGLALVLAACSQNPFAPAKPAAVLNTDKLEAEIDQKMGGIGTCVIIADVASGHELYRYNAPECRAPLPPCSTFDIPSALAGLDAGVITPATVVKWDGSPQPTKEWQADADIGAASQKSILWWWQRLSTQIGHDRLEAALKAYDYGNRNVDGPPATFWLGPQSGGALALSTEQQLSFLRRLYNGGLPVKPQTAGVVAGLLPGETRTDAAGPATVTGKAASCASTLRRSSAPICSATSRCHKAMLKLACLPPRNSTTLSPPILRRPNGHRNSGVPLALKAATMQGVTPDAAPIWRCHRRRKS